MNLVSDPWIPVVMQDGASCSVSLRDVFSEGERFADLAANPCQRIALMRLLICIAQAALDGPKDEADWLSCRSRLLSAALAYLDKWQHRFNLFGEHAFLQVDGLEAAPNALADKIDLALACGNNPTLFDHAATPAGRVHTDAQLALNLLVYQMFSPGGLIGIRVWDKRNTEKTSEHAPCLEGSMLHTILRGTNLSDTIHLNLLTRDQLASLPNMGWGVPNWEVDMTRESLKKNAPTYLARLVPIPRAINFAKASAQIVLAAGTLYEKLPGQREPMGTVIEIGSGAKKRFSYLSVSPEKHPWRELNAILTLRKADKQGGPLCLFHLRTTGQTTFDIWTGGLSADKAKLIDMADWNFMLPVELLDTLVLARYQQGVEIASSAKSVLRDGVKQYSQSMKADPTWQSKAELLFWGDLDAQSQALVTCAIHSDESLAEKWIPIIRDSLLAAYSRTCPHETPRQIQAYAQGLKKIKSWNGGSRYGS